MKNFSFIFVGTSEPALNCLQLLMKCPAFSLKGLLTRPDSLRGRGLKKQSSLIKAFAQKQAFPVWTVEKTDKPHFLNEIRQKKCDFSFVCSYGQILPLAYLQIFPKGGINLHFSLLPRWRGAAPVERALMAGDQKTGVSLQIMTEGLDTGDLIGQRSFVIEESDHAGNVFEKALKEARFLLQSELIKYLKGELKAFPQDHSKRTVAKKIKKEEGEILWEEESLSLHNKIRALFLGPQAFSFWRGWRLKIYKSQALFTNFPGFSPGEVCLVKKDALFIACGKGALSLIELQREGKNKQNIKEFLKGCPIKLRDLLGKENKKAVRRRIR